MIDIPVLQRFGTLPPNLRTWEREKSGLRDFSGRPRPLGEAMKAFARGKIFVSRVARGCEAAGQSCTDCPNGSTTIPSVASGKSGSHP